MKPRSWLLGFCVAGAISVPSIASASAPAVPGGLRSGDNADMLVAMVPVETGQWGGTHWALSAGALHGVLCMSLSESGATSNVGCSGPQGGLTPKMAIVKAGWTFRGLPRPEVAGAVSVDVTRVAVTFSNGQTLNGGRPMDVRPVTSRLVPGVAFFAAPIPCGADQVSITALGRNGKTLGSTSAATGPLTTAICGKTP